MSLLLLVKLSYFVAATLFLLGLQRMASPKTARSGIQWAGVGMVLATITTFFLPDLHNIPLMIVAIVHGVVVNWVWGKKVALTDMPQMVALFNGMGGGSAACHRRGRTVPLLERRPPRRTYVTAFGTSRAGGVRRADRRGVAHRFGDRLGQARRPHGQALHLPGPAGVQHRPGRAGDRHGARRPRRDHARPGLHHRLLRDRAAARRADHAAHRRRRHAGGDLAVQRLHRPRRRLRRLRAGQRGADHRRHDGGRGGHPAHQADGQGDEPLHPVGAVLQLRRHRPKRQGHRRQPEAHRRQRRRRDDGLRRTRGHRAGLRPRRRPGAAQDLGTVAEADRSRREGEVRHPPPSPAACPAT